MMEQSRGSQQVTASTPGREAQLGTQQHARSPAAVKFYVNVQLVTKLVYQLPPSLTEAFQPFSDTHLF